MNEEQIDKLVWEIHTKADAKRILLAVAAEAREEGRKEGIGEAAKAIECDGPWTLLGAIARVNALKDLP